MREQIVEYAKTFLGTPYKTLDCNELVRKTFRKFGVELGDPSAGNAKDLYNRGLTSDILTSSTIEVIKSKLQPGDLVFWKNDDYKLRWKHIHHVAIYIGNGKIIESKGVGVQISNLWESKKWQIILIGYPIQLIQEDEDMVSANSEPKYISMVQTALSESGFQCDMDASKFGSWGAKTDAAIKAFKTAHGLPADSLMNTVTLCTLLVSLVDEIAVRDVALSADDTIFASISVDAEKIKAEAESRLG